MERWMLILVVCLVAAFIRFGINTFFMLYTEKAPTDFLPTFLRSLVLLAGMMVLEKFARDNVTFTFFFAFGFDYFYTRFFGPH